MLRLGAREKLGPERGRHRGEGGLQPTARREARDEARGQQPGLGGEVLRCRREGLGWEGVGWEVVAGEGRGARAEQQRGGHCLIRQLEQREAAQIAHLGVGFGLGLG